DATTRRSSARTTDGLYGAVAAAARGLANHVRPRIEHPIACGLASPVLFVVIVAARGGYGCFKMSALTTTAEPGPLFSTQCTVSLVSKSEVPGPYSFASEPRWSMRVPWIT